MIRVIGRVALGALAGYPLGVALGHVLHRLNIRSISV